MAANGIARALSTIDSIMGCESMPALSEQVLRPVARLVDADSAVYMRFRQDSAKNPIICESVYTGPHPESVDAYVSGFYVEDPVMRPLIDCARAGAGGSPMSFQLSNQVRQGALRQSNYFRNFLRPHELGDIMGIALPFDCDGPQLLCLGLHRQAGRPIFESSQRQALETVMRPVRRALEMLCLQSVLAEQAALISGIEQSGTLVEYAVIDDQFRVLRGSGRLRALLTSNHPEPHSLSSIRAAMQALATAASDAQECIDVTLPDGRPGKLSTISKRHVRNYVLVPSDVKMRFSHSLPAEGVHASDRLTTREQQVIDELANGGSNARIAETLNISIRTVENHLRSIYEKMGINSRTQLISMLFTH